MMRRRESAMTAAVSAATRENAFIRRKVQSINCAGSVVGGRRAVVSYNRQATLSSISRRPTRHRIIRAAFGPLSRDWRTRIAAAAAASVIYWPACGVASLVIEISRLVGRREGRTKPSAGLWPTISVRYWRQSIMTTPLPINPWSRTVHYWSRRTPLRVDNRTTSCNSNGRPVADPHTARLSSSCLRWGLSDQRRNEH